MRLRAAAALLVLVLGACGSGDDASAPTDADTRTAAGAGAPTDPYGEYEREVTQADLDRTAEKRSRRPTAELPPTGTWHLTLNTGVLEVVDPTDFRIAQEIEVTDTVLEIRRYFHVSGGQYGIFCEDDSPSSYTWELDGDRLTLASETDACADRDSVLTGTWTTSD